MNVRRRSTPIGSLTTIARASIAPEFDKQLLGISRMLIRWHAELR
ncbi:MAG: hypothetical protein WD738_04605 [Pirellulales bacterium]